VSPLSILAPQYEMTRHGHRRLARLGQAINAGFSGRTVKDNYRLDTTPVVSLGLRTVR
jgi:hypothetical protein